jgi:hypothetical protein
MPDVYDAFKPLRNYLRHTDLINGLGAVRWYIMHFQLPNPPQQPPDMQIDPVFWEKGFTMTIPWQMAVLARELIIEGVLTGPRHDLRQWKDLAAAVNKLKDIDEYISQHYVNQSNVEHIVTKVMAHQQFIWQENRPNRQTFNRYYFIYQHPQLRSIFEKFFGMSVEKYYAFAMITWGNYINNLGLNYPPNINLPKLGGTAADYELFIKHYALPLDELRKRLTDPSERHFGDDFFYYYDTLKTYPMILTEINGQPSHVCPVPTYLFWRTTDGIYYELVNEKGFGQALGEAYKSYIGEVLNQQTYSRKVTVLDADTYIKAELPKPDWLFIESDQAGFIECKAKRMTISAKNEMTLDTVTASQLTKLAESVVQCYKAIIDAKQRSYKELAGVKRYYPIVVTLESWFIQSSVSEKLEELVQKLATADGLDPKFLAKHPYIVVSSHEFENFVARLCDNQVGDIIEPYFDPTKYDRWAFDTYLRQAFPLKKAYKLFPKNHIDIALEKITGQAIT